LLDKICHPYFENDFGALQDAKHVPHPYSKETNAKQIDTADQLLRASYCFCDYFVGLSVTAFIRTCTDAALLRPDKIAASHMTDPLRNGTRLRQPYMIWAIKKKLMASGRLPPSRTQSPIGLGKRILFTKAPNSNTSRSKGGLTDNLPI
jgi:hypothetical protein